ncbi:MAG TPA: hypothetical protein VEJ18_10135, partial [Planctomycetota bacterium]|nr:hypothetical protein [Planctomycetota bacterium]
IVVAAVGTVAVVISLKPPEYLQDFIVLAGGGAAATCLVPVVMGLFWRRATAAGAITALIAGGGTVLTFAFLPASWRLGVDPFIWALAASALLGPAVSLLTAPPPREVVDPLFDARAS